MSFNIPTFSIPGMMPTTHPVADSILTTAYDGSVDVVFSESATEPTFVSFRITSHSGEAILEDPSGEYYVRNGLENKFVFGDDEAGYLPSGTWFLWVKQDSTVYKLTLHNPDTGFNKGWNPSAPLPEEDPTPASTPTIGTYNWNDCRTGDTFPGITTIRIKSGGVPPTVPVLSARIRFRSIKGSTGTPSLELNTENGGIIISDSVNWEFNIPAFVVSLGPGTYYYDMETTTEAPESLVRTYLEGSWKITPDN